MTPGRSRPERLGVVLASASPRRRLLLPLVRPVVTTLDPEMDESPLPGEAATDLAARLALEKARHAASLLDVQKAALPVIAADTVVALGGAALGKPQDAAEARRMLRALAGRQHHVVTGVAVVGPRSARVGVATTAVDVRGLSAAEIEASIQRGDPFDKAGGYAIQDPILRPVAGLHGCFPNVVGLPLCVVQRLLDDPAAEGDLSPAHIPCRLCFEAARALRSHGFWAPEHLEHGD